MNGVFVRYGCPISITLSAACGSVESSSIPALASDLAQDAPSNTAAAAGSGKILHEFDAGEQVVSFVEYTDDQGTSTVVLGERFSAFAKGALSDRAIESVGKPLTMLELFYAFAPADEIPNEALVRAHELEVVALNRTGNELLKVDIDLSAPVEKSIASCEAWVYDLTGQDPGTYFGSRGIMNNVTGWQSLCLYGSCGLYTQAYTRSGACNESNAEMSARGAWGYAHINNGAWLYTSWEPVGPYTARRWTIPTSANAKRMAVDASSSGTYHLRTGRIWIDH